MLTQGKLKFNELNYTIQKLTEKKKIANFRWVPTLTSDDVADRVISAIQRKEKLAIIPRYLQLMLCVKWYKNFISSKITIQ